MATIINRNGTKNGISDWYGTNVTKLLPVIVMVCRSHVDMVTGGHRGATRKL